MIIIENLVVSYDKRQNIINSLNLVLSDNTINGIVGLNGAGKTTLLNSIYGLKSIDRGTIKSNDKKVNKKEISFLETENYFYSNITGREYLSLFKNLLFDPDKWNQLFLLPLDTIVDDYSTGMKKKLAFMAILLQKNDFFILDEPFNGLDIQSNILIKEIILTLKQRNKTVIMSSHIFATLHDTCDEIHVLKEGSVYKSVMKSDFLELERELKDFTIGNRIEKLNL